MPGLAPINANKRGANGKQMEKINATQATPIMIDCTAATAAPSLSCSPVRRATTAVVPMLRPTAIAMIITSIPSVMPTVAMASAPRWATKKMSTMPNSDSMAISSTMGTASRTMARLIEMAVKFWRVPKIASLIKDSTLAVRDCGEVCVIELKRFSMMAVERNTMAHSRKQNCREGYAGGKAGNQGEAWLTWRGTSLRKTTFYHTSAAGCKKILI